MQLSSSPSLHRSWFCLKINFEQIFKEEPKGKEQIINLPGAVTGLGMNPTSHESLKQTNRVRDCKQSRKSCSLLPGHQPDYISQTPLWLSVAT